MTRTTTYAPPTASLDDVLVTAVAFNLARELAAVVSVTTNATYGSSATTPVIQLQVSGREADVDALADLFQLDDEVGGHYNYTRRGEFQGRSVEVYSGRSAS